MSWKIVSPEGLAGKAGVLLLDVRLPEDFGRVHLPGAVNNCVFEVAFGERLSGIAPDKKSAICVYGADGESLEGRIAAEKLIRAGYENVRELHGGLAGWQTAGQPVEGKNIPSPQQTPPDGVIPIDLQESRVEWTGRNLLNKHHGFVTIKSGRLEFAQGRLTGGEFLMDMTSLACSDLQGDVLHDVLIAHLRSDDFFDTERYPEARFVITRTEMTEAPPGTPNLTVHGLLTVKDATHEIAFSAVAGVTAEGKPAAQATLAFDRTKWNVLYGSGKFFRNLGGHLVNDLIEIQLRIVAAEDLFTEANKG